MVGDFSKGQLYPEHCMDPRRDNRATQRVAAEIEEIVISADIRQIKNLCPNIGKQYFCFSLRLFTFGIVANREGILAECYSINLVTFVVGQTFQKYDS